MFKKSVSNVDLYNKLSHLDNKLDVILTKLNEGTVRIHEQLIEDKFTCLQEELITKISGVDKNVEMLKQAFENYRQDLITNLQIIVCNLDKFYDLDKYKLAMEKYIVDVETLEKRVDEKLNDVTHLIYEIDLCTNK
jgi:hypothetical protein